jgi:hypothetical protein
LPFFIYPFPDLPINGVSKSFTVTTAFDTLSSCRNTRAPSTIIKKPYSVWLEKAHCEEKDLVGKKHMAQHKHAPEMQHGQRPVYSPRALAGQ